MLWFLVAISAYLILAVVFLVDKYLLTSSILNPRVYAFYVGTLGILVLILAPFVGFFIPEKSQIALSLLAGAIFVYGLFWFYKTLQLFEPSRALPTIGGLTPLFTLGLIYLFSWGKETLSSKGVVAFTLLILGSILINIKVKENFVLFFTSFKASVRERLINLKSLKFSVFTAFLLSLSFVLIKYVYLAQPFWNGFIWKSIGGFLMAACFFIFFPEIKKEIFKNRVPRSGMKVEKNAKRSSAERGKFPKKTTAIFVTNQAAGAGANILQNWAIALAPLAYVAIINALQGVQYVFLLIFTIFLSLKLPQIVKEEISRKIILQKIFAILLIATGLAILALK